jgi:hypothetical protein
MKSSTLAPVGLVLFSATMPPPTSPLKLYWLRKVPDPERMSAIFSRRGADEIVDQGLGLPKLAKPTDASARSPVTLTRWMVALKGE